MAAYAHSKYQAKAPDAQGRVLYTPEENAIWHDLYHQQITIVQGRGCDEYLRGLDILDMSPSRIPQIPEVNQILQKATGWQVHPVDAIIGFEAFFELLANRQFPAATFIRTREDFEYITEPDIFHELFGHCPMLTEPVYADFMEAYGRIGLNASHSDRVALARLYWFTVEFGLINTAKGLRIYGGGILSSKSETVYAVESNIPSRKPFVALDALRTPYRIDILQTIYYVIDGYRALYDLVNSDLLGLVAEAHRLGMFAPTYPPAEEDDKSHP
jgi:phenylalanine-4-hydroxylase